MTTIARILKEKASAAKKTVAEKVKAQENEKKRQIESERKSLPKIMKSLVSRAIKEAEPNDLVKDEFCFYFSTDDEDILPHYERCQALEKFLKKEKIKFRVGEQQYSRPYSDDGYRVEGHTSTIYYLDINENE